MSRRSDRVAVLIRAELADLLVHHVKDPRVRLASITTVALSADLQHARVGVSVLGDDDERERTIEVLQHARGFLRSQLARRLRLRITPELLFELDRGAEHSQRIEQLLENLHGGDETS